MYVGIDVGGTKTLVASLTNEGVIKHSLRFPTPKEYDDFLGQLLGALHQLPEHDFKAGGIGIPVLELDRKHDLGISLGNLPWKNVKVRQDVAKLTRCPMVLENDAKMGGLSEALRHPKAEAVLYIALGTGIGIALVNNGVIDTAFGDSGGRTLLIEWQGALRPWESFASGHAIFERFGMKASEIEDDAIWQTIAHDITLGLVDLIALTEPDLVVLGGGVGTHFDKYGRHLQQQLKALAAGNPLLQIPRVAAAQYPEEAVVYGCYQLARHTHG